MTIKWSRIGSTRIETCKPLRFNFTQCAVLTRQRGNLTWKVSFSQLMTAVYKHSGENTWHFSHRVSVTRNLFVKRAALHFLMRTDRRMLQEQYYIDYKVFLSANSSISRNMSCLTPLSYIKPHIEWHTWEKRHHSYPVCSKHTSWAWPATLQKKLIWFHLVWADSR